MRLAFLDASSGISGDMLLAAAVAAGADLAPINRAFSRLGLEGEIEAETVTRAGVQAVRLWFRRPGAEPTPLGGTDAGANGAAEPNHPHVPPPHDHPRDAPAQPPRRAKPGRDPGGAHPHAAGAAHSHRTLGDILRILDHAGLTPTVAARARTVFQALARAEARVHGHAADKPLDQLHFHEVGQDDAIMDVVGAAMALEQLGIERLQCSPLNTGSGQLTCAHGRFPVPAPATLELLRGLPVYSDGTEAELVTPTGAALVRTLAQGFGAMPALRPESVGYGAGSYDLPGHPDLLRLVIGRAEEAGGAATAPAVAAAGNEVAVLEANVDDMNPEFYGYLVERALALGALDIFSCPVQMKKNRPGLWITVLAPLAETDRLTALLLAETTTLGVRAHRAQRTVLERQLVPVETRYGVIRVKTGGGDANAAPEYEDCREAALRAGVPLKRVYQEALRVYLDSRAE